MQNYPQYGAQGAAPAYYSVGATQQGNPTVSYTSTGTGGAAASTYSYNMAPNPVAGGYTTSYGQMPSYGMSQSYTSGSGGQLYAPAGLQVPGLIQAPSAAVSAAGPFKFYSTPVQETIAEGSPMAASSPYSPAGSVAVGTPFNSAGVPPGFAVPETVPVDHPLTIPTAAALGPSPAGSMNAGTAFGSATSYQASLPGTTENMVPASSLSLPTEQQLSGTYPGYHVPVSGSGASFPLEPGSPVTAPGTQEVLVADAPLPAYGQLSPQGASSPFARPNPIPATAPAGLTPPRVQPIILQAGMACQIQGLDSLPGAPNLNGMQVILVSEDQAKQKWVVQQQDGKKARVPSAALTPLPRQS